MERIRQFLAISMISLSVIVLLLGPVDVLEISKQGGVEGDCLSIALPLGQSFVTAYVHSVQKTPVEDEYLMQGRKLWQWEERFVSHNAGLPVNVPRNGTFLEQDNWMIIRGGRAFFEPLFYRVGTQALGRNCLVLPGYGEWALYLLWPGDRLIFQARQEPLLWGLTRTRVPDVESFH